MSILGAVLEGVAQGLGIEESHAAALTKLLDPTNFESRKEESVALEASLGYDPEKYWNRKEMVDYLAEMAGIDPELSDYQRDESFIDKALDNFEKSRNSFFDFAFKEADLNKKLNVLDDEDLDDEDEDYRYEDDDEAQSLREEAQEIDDESFGEDLGYPEEIEEEDFEE